MSADDQQRRQNFRVDLSGRCRLKIGRYPETDAELVDLSGTGCSVHTRLPGGKGDRGTITVAFAEWTLKTTVVVRFARTQPGRRFLGLEFDGLFKADRDRVVREVFALQRRQLGKLRRGDG
jgi:c-di-GMP-binding flagellar brake protein YcgR